MYLIGCLSFSRVGGSPGFLRMDGRIRIWALLWKHFLLPGMLCCITATAVLLLGKLFFNHRKGYSWKRALPREYMFTLWGLGIAFAAGFGDMFWHGIFGIEEGIEALLSPTHLLLAVGGAVVVSGPLHAIWYRDRSSHFLHTWVVVLSFAYLLMTLGFMLQFLHPFNFPWPAQSFLSQYPIDSDIAGGLGIANAVVFTTVFMGLLLATMRNFRFPLGSMTLILGLNALTMTLMHGQYYEFILTTVIAGIYIDVLYKQMASLEIKAKHLRWFGFLAPAALFTVYTATIMVADSTPWSAHMWAGMIVIAGLVGYLLTYLVVPPGDGVIRAKFD
jgi:hypothetical protein